MECDEVQTRLFRKIDGELSESEIRELDSHLAQCQSCAREYGLMALPRRIAPIAPQATQSPFFYQKLRLRIDREAQTQAGWQILWGIARHMIPAMAGITLALLSILAYVQMHSPKADLYSAYDMILIPEDQPNRLLTVEQGDITDASVLRAIAERNPNHGHSDSD